MQSGCPHFQFVHLLHHSSSQPDRKQQVRAACRTGGDDVTETSCDHRPPVQRSVPPVSSRLCSGGPPPVAKSTQRRFSFPKEEHLR